MLYHYPDPFNISAIKAGSSDESGWKGKSCSTEKNKQTTTIIIIIAQLLVRECRRAVVTHGEVFVLREHRNLWNWMEFSLAACGFAGICRIPYHAAAGRASTPRWTAPAPRSATEPSTPLGWTRTSWCPDCWWAGTWRKSAMTFGCRSWGRGPRAGLATDSSCCGSSSAHRWASSWARPDSSDRAAGHSRCSTRCAEPPRTTWRCS